MGRWKMRLEFNETAQMIEFDGGIFVKLQALNHRILQFDGWFVSHLIESA